jgi:hypothetical protein
MADHKDDKNNSADPKGNDLIDIESIEVSVLILAKHPNGQRQAAAFLNKRGWPTSVTGSISEALNILVNKRPDVVLVSFNHPHPAIMKLPDVLTQTFNIFSVGYVETADAPSTARLAQAKMLHKLLGFPSGPSIQRLIRRILEERLGPLTMGGGDLVAKSNPKDGNDEKANAENIQIIRGMKSAPAKYVMETGTVKKKFKDVNSKYGGKSSMSSILDPAKSKDLLSKLKQSLLPESQAGLDSEYGAESILPDTQDDMYTRMVSEMPPALSPATQKSNDKLETQALLEQAVESALRKSFKPEAGTNVKPLPPKLMTNRVAVMSVESPVLHGYLVATPAEPLEKKAADQFLKDIKTSLEDNFVSLSVPGRIDSGFWVDIPEVEFNQWMADAALFHLKVPHEGSEIGVGYFPTESVQVVPKKSKKSPGMYAVDLKDISTEVPVNFKAYLPMEDGKKPFLYLRNGRTLQPEQKERLSSNNVTELCMKSVDVENFKAFAASVHLASTMKKKAA